MSLGGLQAPPLSQPSRAPWPLGAHDEALRPAGEERPGRSLDGLAGKSRLERDAAGRLGGGDGSDTHGALRLNDSGHDARSFGCLVAWVTGAVMASTRLTGPYKPSVSLPSTRRMGLQSRSRRLYWSKQSAAFGFFLSSNQSGFFAVFQTACLVCAFVARFGAQYFARGAGERRERASNLDSVRPAARLMSATTRTWSPPREARVFQTRRRQCPVRPRPARRGPRGAPLASSAAKPGAAPRGHRPGRREPSATRARHPGAAGARTGSSSTTVQVVESREGRGHRARRRLRHETRASR